VCERPQPSGTCITVPLLHLSTPIIGLDCFTKDAIVNLLPGQALRHDNGFGDLLVNRLVNHHKARNGLILDFKRESIRSFPVFPLSLFLLTMSDNGLDELGKGVLQLTKGSARRPSLPLYPKLGRSIMPSAVTRFALGILDCGKRVLQSQIVVAL
jgi:hypothetical protein